MCKASKKSSPRTRSVRALVVLSLLLGSVAVSGNASILVNPGGEVREIVHDPERYLFYVSLDTGEVLVLNSGGITKRVMTPGDADALAVTPDGSRLYVGLKDTQQIAVYSLPGVAHLDTWSTSSLSGPGGLAANEDRLYASAFEGLSVIDTATGSELYRGWPDVTLPSSDHALALRPDGERLLVLSDGYLSYPRSINVLDVNDDLDPLYLGHYPCGGDNITYDPDGLFIYGCLCGAMRVLEATPILHAQYNGFLPFAEETDPEPIPATAMAISPEFGLACLAGYDEFVLIRTNDWLAYYHGYLEGNVGPGQMAIASDNITIAVGLYNQIEIIDSSSLIPNMGGVRSQPRSSNTGTPIRYSSMSGPGLGASDFVEVVDGVLGLMPVEPIDVEGHFLVTAPGHVTYGEDLLVSAGQWTDLGVVTLTFSGSMPGIAYTGVAPAALVGRTTDVQIRSIGFQPGLTVTSNDSEVIIDSFAFVDWATISASIEITAGAAPGLRTNAIRVHNPDGLTKDGDIVLLVPPPPTVKLGSSLEQVDEQTTTVAISVVRNHAATGAVSVDWATSSGSASAGQDFQAGSGTLNWMANDTSSRSIVVTVLTDDLVEGDEYFTVNLSNPVNVFLEEPDSCRINIIDDDISYLQLSSTGFYGDEDGGSAQVTITRRGGSVAPASVQVSTSNGTATAPADFTALSGYTCNWPAADTSDCVVPISLVDDAFDEGTETFTVTLSNPVSAEIASPSAATVSIIDDDHAGLLLSSAAYVAGENSGSATVTVRRIGPTAGATSVDYTTANGAAFEGIDYQTTAGTLTWAGGDGTARNVNVPLINDSLTEEDETFSFTLSNPTGSATLEPPSSAVVTIADDDNRTLQMSAGTYSASEGGSVVVTITRDGHSSEAIGVSYSTGGGSATVGVDYQSASGTLSWGDGDMSDRTVTINTNNDAQIEGHEVFIFSLSSPSGAASVGTPEEAMVTIIDDEWTEIPINTYTPNLQIRPSVAMADSDSSVVVWQSFNQDGSGYGIFGQRFNASGSPAGAELPINTTTDNDQTFPSVAINAASGGFVVVWQSMLQDGSNTGVYCRRFSAAGAALSGELQVNQETLKEQGRPVVAIADSGAFLVAWQSFEQDGSEYGVYTRAYNANGVAIGNEVRANTYTALDQEAPAVAAGPGGYVVVWESLAQESSRERIVARLFNANGVAQGGEVVLSSSSYSCTQPAVTAHGSGYLVVWEASGQDGSGLSIVGQMCTASLTPSGSSFVINTFTTGDQQQPSVSSDGSLATVIWESIDQDGSFHGIFGRGVALDGSPVGYEMQMNTYTSGPQHHPSVSSSASNARMMVWASSGQDGSGEGIYGVLSYGTGNPLIFYDGFESGNTSAWTWGTQ